MCIMSTPADMPAQTLRGLDKEKGKNDINTVLIYDILKNNLKFKK